MNKSELRWLIYSSSVTHKSLSIPIPDSVASTNFKFLFLLDSEGKLISTIAEVIYILELLVFEYGISKYESNIAVICSLPKDTLHHQ
jgi:hypothetical protein